MSVRGVKLREGTHSKRVTYYMMPFMWNSPRPDHSDEQQINFSDVPGVGAGGEGH